MMSKTCTTLLLLLGLTAVSVHCSAIKGHQQVQPVQRLDEQAVRAVKSPVQQQSDRSPKSVPVVKEQQPVASAPVVLESSKKVYNDESIRRSLSQQAAVEPAVAVKSPPESIVSQPAVQPIEQVQPVSAPVVPVAAPKEAVVVPVAVVQPQPVAPVASPVAPAVEPVKPAVEQPVVPVVPVAPVASGVPVVPVVRAAEELPAQSERSAQVKDEQLKPKAVVDVEQSVPAKVPEQVVQQAPVVESKPAVAPVQPEAAVVKQVDSPLQAKKDEPVVKESPESLAIEVPAPDPGLVLSEPIDSTTKLLIDLDEHVQKFLPAEDKQEPAQPPKDQVLVSGVDYSPAAVGESQPSGKSSVPLVPYSSNVENEPIVPPLPSLEKVEKASGAQASPPAAGQSNAAASGQSATRQANHQHQNQQQVITQLLDQLDSLQNRIQDTINQLVARRRYVMSALLRPMGTYVRRVRTNLERLQNRVNQLQAAAVSVGGGQGGNRPGGFVDAAAIETIRRRIDDISKRISDIVNRIRFSLTPTSAPLNNNGRK